MTHRLSDVLSALDEITELVDELRSGAPALHRKAREATRPGYPEQVLGGPGQRHKVSDPTLAAVIANDGDATRRAWRLVGNSILNARGSLRGAKATSDAEEEPAPRRTLADVDEASVGVDWCVACHQAGVHSAVVKAGRCGACYEYRRKSGQDPPPSVVQQREFHPSRKRVG